MPNYLPITRERHVEMKWKRQSNFTFAAAESVVPLTVMELSMAVMSLPMGFVEQNGEYLLVGVLSLQPGNNVFVDAEWKWVGSYIPAMFRSYPFRLLKTEEGQMLLCIDEDSGLLSEGGSGESFFGEDGKPSPPVQDAIKFLNLSEQSRVATGVACAALQKYDLIRPWPITVRSDNNEKKVEGLFQVDEAALNQLPIEALSEIRDAGALPLAYCQLLSMQHLQLLGQLSEAQAKASEQALTLDRLAPGGELDMESFSKGGTFNFGNL